MKSMRYYQNYLPSRIILLAIGLIATLILIVFSAHVNAASAGSEGGKLITIHDRGQEKVILTNEDNLSDALKQADIVIEEHDTVEPAIDSKLVASSYQVNIYRAKPVIVVDGNTQTSIMTSHKSGKDIAKDAGITLRDEDQTEMKLSLDVVSNGPAQQLIIHRATKFNLNLYSDTTTAYTQGKTVGDMLDEKGIKLGEKDGVTPSKSTKITEGMTVKVWRDGKKTVTKKEKIKYNVRVIKDVDRPASYKKVKTEGQNGQSSVTYEITTKDGKVISRKKIQSVVLRKPVEKVVIVGTKFKYTGGKLSEEQITALGKCESGMTATRNSGNGFYGAFQFMPSTWRSHAPAGFKDMLPSDAPLDVQKQAVQHLLSRSSIYTQFPGCAKKMNARGVI